MSACRSCEKPHYSDGEFCDDCRGKPTFWVGLDGYSPAHMRLVKADSAKDAAEMYAWRNQDGDYTEQIMRVHVLDQNWNHTFFVVTIKTITTVDVNVLESPSA